MNCRKQFIQLLTQTHQKMNKTINVNLGGLFFHVDETAFFKLKNYLDAIKNSLREDEEGKQEILNDIESRISELLSERITDKRQVINENDIDEVIKIMGKPEDYLVDEELFEDRENSKHQKTFKKLFRDVNNKYIGGVCSGLGHYVGIEAVWLRIIFILLLLSGFSAGVGSHSFIKIGFFPMIFIYIILWILIPAAITTAQKLQMKGKPVTIDNIEQKIKEEINYVAQQTKKGAKTINDKVKSEEFKQTINDGRNIFEKIVEGIIAFVLFCFKVVGKMIGILLILTTSIIFISLFIGVFSWGSLEILGADEFVKIPDVAYASILPTWLLVTATFVAIGIPTIALFVLGLKILSSKTNVFNKTTWFTFLGLWVLAMVVLAFTAIDVETQRSHSRHYSEVNELPFLKNDTIFVKMNDFYSYRSYNSLHVQLKEISLAKDNQALLKIKKESMGRSEKEALEAAKKLEYSYKVENDKLILNNDFVSDRKNKFKHQRVSLSLIVPSNMIIYFNKEAVDYTRYLKGLHAVSENDKYNHYYKMTEEGLIRVDTLANFKSVK